jgi:hypothetical protein
MPLSQKQFEIRQQLVVRKIKVILQNEQVETMFFCPFCRNPILKHCQRVVQIEPDDKIGTMPIEVKCKNKNCGVVFTFYTLI